MSRTTRIILGVGALLAALCLMAVSIAANVKFARSFGQSELDKVILSGASIASDLFKSVAVAVLFFMIARRRWVGAASIAALGSVSIVFSLMSATGFVAGERFHSFYIATAARDNTAADRQMLIERQKDRGWLPTNKPLPVVEAEIAALRLDPSWAATNGCRQYITAGRRETLCRRYGELSVELAAAQTAKAEDARIAAARQEIRDHGREYGDPLVETIRAFVGVDERTILLGLIALSVALIEIGSALGLPVALAMLMPDKASTVLAVTPRAPTFRVDPAPEEAVVSIRQGVPPPIPRRPMPPVQNPAVASVPEPVRRAPQPPPVASVPQAPPAMAEPATAPPTTPAPEPDPVAVHRIVPRQRPSFPEPAADMPVAGGLKGGIRRASAAEVAAMIERAKANRVA
jgi:hypothetical protein